MFSRGPSRLKEAHVALLVKVTRHMPSLVVLLKVSRALSVSLDRLVRTTPEPKTARVVRSSRAAS